MKVVINIEIEFNMWTHVSNNNGSKKIEIIIIYNIFY